jgi:predicted transcriptional regulator
MSSIAHANLNLTIDPALPEHWPSLRSYIAFRVQEQRLNASALAGKMDLSPSVLSRKLNQPEGDTQRFNCDDLEGYIKATGDIASVMSYLAAKFLESPEARQTRAVERVESLASELQIALERLKASK